jgi:hypothetical protein
MAKRPDAAALLSLVADALNACERGGLKVRFHHGIVETKGGYVIPIDAGWVPRTKAYTEFSPEGDHDDD